MRRDQFEERLEVISQAERERRASVGYVSLVSREFIPELSCGGREMLWSDPVIWYL